MPPPGTQSRFSTLATTRLRLGALLAAICLACVACGVSQPLAALTLAASPGFGLTWSGEGSRGVSRAKPLTRTHIELGRSVQGTPLTMELFGDGPDAILIVGGLHGNEPNGTTVAAKLASYLHGHPECLTGRTVGILAQANPDGLLSGTRANARGVDLNRNFPSRRWRPAAGDELSHGARPASEPETLAVMIAIEIVKPSRIVDIHSIPSDRHCNNYDGPAEHLAELMSLLNGYPVTSDIGYPTPGALSCWAGIDLGIPAVTLELPRGQSSEQAWRDNAAALLAVIDAGDQQLARRSFAQASSH